MEYVLQECGYDSHCLGSYVAELGVVVDKNKIEKQPLIVMLTLAKIKLPTGQYLVLISSIMLLFSI